MTFWNWRRGTSTGVASGTAAAVAYMPELAPIELYTAETRIVGWIEENKHPYFFVLNFESADANADIPAIRMKMLKGILKQLGFMEGKM